MSNNVYDKYYQEFYAKNNLSKGGHGNHAGNSDNCHGTNIVNTNHVNIPNCSDQHLQNIIGIPGIKGIKGCRGPSGVGTQIIDVQLDEQNYLVFTLVDMNNITSYQSVGPLDIINGLKGDKGMQGIIGTAGIDGIDGNNITNVTIDINGNLIVEINNSMQINEMIHKIKFRAI